MEKWTDKIKDKEMLLWYLFRESFAYFQTLEYTEGLHVTRKDVSEYSNDLKQLIQTHFSVDIMEVAERYREVIRQRRTNEAVEIVEKNVHPFIVDAFEEIRERLSLITKGKWEIIPYKSSYCIKSNDVTILTTFKQDDPDINFIAHAPDDVRQLLSEVDRLKREKEEASFIIQDLQKQLSEARKTSTSF